MRTMIERLARAICAANQMDPDSKSHINGNALHWEDYVKDAEAALAELREPSDEMCAVGAEHWYGDDGKANALAVWQEMIDIARNDA